MIGDNKVRGDGDERTAMTKTSDPKVESMGLVVTTDQCGCECQLRSAVRCMKLTWLDWMRALTGSVTKKTLSLTDSLHRRR